MSLRAIQCERDIITVNIRLSQMRETVPSSKYIFNKVKIENILTIKMFISNNKKCNYFLEVFMTNEKRNLLFFFVNVKVGLHQNGFVTFPFFLGSLLVRRETFDENRTCEFFLLIWQVLTCVLNGRRVQTINTLKRFFVHSYTEIYVTHWH